MEGTRGWRHGEGKRYADPDRQGRGSGGGEKLEAQQLWRRGMRASEEVGAEAFPQTPILLPPPVPGEARDPHTEPGKDRHALERVM